MQSIATIMGKILLFTGGFLLLLDPFPIGTLKHIVGRPAPTILLWSAHPIRDKTVMCKVHHLPPFYFSYTWGRFGQVAMKLKNPCIRIYLKAIFGMQMAFALKMSLLSSCAWSSWYINCICMSHFSFTFLIIPASVLRKYCSVTYLFLVG